MDMGYIKLSNMLMFLVILYSPPHLLMLLTGRNILMVTIATYIKLLSVKYKSTEETSMNELQLQKLHSNI